jgi:membrane-associated phospholipid phosphatase
VALRAASALETRLLLVALICLVVTLAIGALVATREPTRIDVDAFALRNRALPLALFFTSLGRWQVLLGLGVLAFGVAMTLGTGLRTVVILVAAQAISQWVTALLKLGFRRARSDDWLHKKERDLSYPSGHSVTSIVFFLGFAILIWHSPMPRPVAVAACAALLVCVVAIPWSRLALGAHYLTDVIGGLLLGTAVLSAALATILRFTPVGLT